MDLASAKEVFSRVVLEAGIYLSHIIWRIRYRKLRKEAKETGKSIDDLLELRRRDTEESRDLETGVLDQDQDKDQGSRPTGAEIKREIQPGTATGPSMERSEMSEKW